MSASIHCIYTISKAKDNLGKTIVILKGSLDYGAVYQFRQINRSAMADGSVPVKVADEASNPTLKVEGLFVISLFLPEAYFQLLIQVSHLPQPLAEGIKIISDATEYFVIGEKGDGSAGIIGLADFGYLCLGYALAVFLLIQLAIAPYINPEPGGKGIDH